jgi:hypothetical protein
MADEVRMSLRTLGWKDMGRIEESLEFLRALTFLGSH